jgi:hypothetical protein
MGRRPRGEVDVELEELRRGMSPARGSLTKSACWYEDDERLLGVSRHGSGDQALDLLAFGLQDLGGRTLQLVIPKAAARATRARAAWLTATVHVHQFHNRTVGAETVSVAQPASSPDESTRFFRLLGRPTPPPDPFDPAGSPDWLVELIDWIESRRVQRVRNSVLHAWHYRGRQVLSVRPFLDGYKLVAGANYQKPTGRQPTPVTLHISATEPLTLAQTRKITEAVDEAIDRRRTGEDHGHGEHLLQAAIGTDPVLIGMTQLRRELYARRPRYKPNQGPAFIDFLGRDVDRVGHVIETKIGPDAQLGIQALDYWAWANAHRTVLAELIDAEPDCPFRLDLVLGRSPKTLLHLAAAATLDALHPEIDWRCHLVTDWDTLSQPKRLLTPKTDALPPRHLPDSTGDSPSYV